MNCITFDLKNDSHKFLELASEYIEKTRKEKGCLSCYLYQNTERNNRMMLTEEWDSSTSKKNHHEKKWTTNLLKRMDEMSKSQRKVSGVHYC